MKTTTFETAKVGDKVWCMRSGWGEIRETSWAEKYPIYVCFLSGDYGSYTLGGFYDDDYIIRTLFWDEVVIEAPAKPMPDLPVDTKVLVWDDPKQKFRRHFSHFKNGHIFTFDSGCTSFSRRHTASIIGWHHWELAE